MLLVSWQEDSRAELGRRRMQPGNRIVRMNREKWTVEGCVGGKGIKRDDWKTVSWLIRNIVFLEVLSKESLVEGTRHQTRLINITRHFI